MTPEDITKKLTEATREYLDAIDSAKRQYEKAQAEAIEQMNALGNGQPKPKVGRPKGSRNKKQPDATASSQITELSGPRSQE